MRLPYVNLRVVVISLVLLLAVAGGAFGYVWYRGRADFLYQEAADGYQQAEKLSQDKDPKAQAAYENAKIRVELFLTKYPTDPRTSKARLLHYKVLSHLARIYGKDEDAKKLAFEERQSPRLYEDAFRSGEMAARLDPTNVEAQAVMLNNHFRRNDFDGAVPYAESLVNSLPTINESAIELEDFNDFVIGAYYVLALREEKLNHPDRVLELLKESLKREQQKPGASRQVPRWRAVWLEVEALYRKSEAAHKSGTTKAARDEADKAFKEAVARYIERARADLKETIPPAEGKPEQPMLATLSQTNSDGLRKFLLLSLAASDSHAQAQERTELLLQVCERLAAAPGAAHWIYQDASGAASHVVMVNAHLPSANRLQHDEMAKVNERVLAVSDKALENSAQPDPTPYLEMSRTAQAEGTKEGRDRALAVAKKGIQVAEEHHLKDTDSLMELRAQAAWLLLMDRKVKEAEKDYLAPMREKKQLVPVVNYMEGLGAVLDGRLDEGAQKLKAAQSSPRYKDNLPLLLGLAQAYLGQGQLENALPVLDQLHAIYEKPQNKNRDDQVWVDTWLPSLTHVTLQLFRAHLTLAQRAGPADDATRHFAAAMKYYPELQKTFLAEEATAALLAFKVAQLRALEAKKQLLKADQVRQEIHKIEEGLPASSRNDPRLLWSEVNVILLEPDTNPDVIAGAVAAPLGAPTDLAVRLGEVGRLRAGSAWQWIKAEERVRQATADPTAGLPTRLAWVRWLLMNNRTQEAVASLTELEARASTPQQKRQIQASRARLLMTTGQAKEAKELIENIRKEGEDITGDSLLLLETLAGGDPKQIEEVIKNGVARNDQSGLFHYWQGQVYQSRGEFVPALEEYERAVQFAGFKGPSENGLLACVLGLASGPADKPEKANPEAAFKEAERLRKSRPDDPVVLLAYAMTARMLDKVYGANGMEGALARMVDVVKKDQPGSAAGAADVAARQWIAAGRPDLARQEVKAYPGHLPSLLLATELAVAEEDWPEVEADLKALEKLQPDALNLPLWRAALLEARGEVDKAKELYQKFVTDHPDLGTGYFALARVYQRSGEPKEALKWVREWQKKAPADPAGIKALVRALAGGGQAPAAAKEAEAYIEDRLKEVREGQDEWEQKNPITDKEKEKDEVARRAKLKAETLDAVRLTLSIDLASAFAEAKAFAEATKWINEKVLPLIEKQPEAVRKANLLGLKLVRSTLYMEQGRQLKEKSPERVKLMDLAIRDYEDIWEAAPGNLVAGNNLAWLLVKEKNDPARALTIIQQVRKSKHGDQPIGGERLPLELLDTLGVVYRANGQSQDSLNLFKDAMQRYGREPRVLMHLAQSQQAIGLKTEAYRNFSAAIDVANERMKTTLDPDRKDQLTKVIIEANDARKQIGLVGTR